MIGGMAPASGGWARAEAAAPETNPDGTCAGTCEGVTTDSGGVLCLPLLVDSEAEDGFERKPFWLLPLAC